MDGAKFGDVHVSQIGGVALVEMRRPPHNFFDVDLIHSLADAFEAVDATRDLRSIVLAAEGKSFCAGHNFKKPAGESRGRDRDALYVQAHRLFSCRKPAVAAVQGAAIGGGLGLVMVGDFRVASPETIFSAPFVRLGLSPGFGLTFTLPRAIGVQRSALMSYTARRIDGATALEWGLVDAIVPATQLRETAIQLATEIAEGAPLALVATRRSLRGDFADQVLAAMRRESQEQQVLSGTKDCAEGTRASMERRTPQFLGE